MSAALQAYIANLSDDDIPDMLHLKQLGVSQTDAIDILTKWQASKTPPPEPQPLEQVAAQACIALENRPIRPLQTAEEFYALSLLHSICQQIKSGRPNPTTLYHEGLSETAANELAKLIRSAYPSERKSA
jgi:hypothetical protein